MKISPEKAEIVGFLCAEGCHFICFSKYYAFSKKSNKSYLVNHRTERTEFSNNHLPLIKHFRKLMFKCYGESPKIISKKRNSEYRILIIRKIIQNDLLRYSDYGHNKWKVPLAVLNGPNNVMAAFIRGVYEGDGTTLFWRGNQPYLEFHMSNLPGLEKIQKMLKVWGIESGIYLSNSKLFIKGHENVSKFAKIVKPKFKKVSLC